MKIAQVTPLYEAVPPKLYGGTERVVAHLTDALMDLGHDVTLFASADARTRARLVPVRDQAIRLVEGILRRTEGIVVRVQTAREVGPGQGYAELVRQYRVTGIDEVRNQRILLAFREAAAGGGWQLVELRILQAGQ